jgi:hypothetical protein
MGVTSQGKVSRRGLSTSLSTVEYNINKAVFAPEQLPCYGL